MSVVPRITFLICVLFIINFISSTPISEKENEKQKEEPSDSTEEGSSEKDNETPSPIEMQNVNENQDENVGNREVFSTLKPEEVETYVEEKEPENVDDKLKNFLALFHEVESKSSEIEEVRKSPNEMKEMKEESYKLLNELNKKLEQPEISYEEFNEMWNKKKKQWGKKFPGIVEKFSVLLKETVEGTDSTTVEATTVEVSEAVTATSTENADGIKEEPPKGVFVVRNDKGKICMLAKFQSSIVITYSGKSSEQKVEVTIPQSGHVKGHCRDPTTGSSLLQITWGKFIFSLFFNETTEDTWVVTLVELTYDTSEPLFDGAAEHTKITVKSKKVNLFETPYGKSYFCPAQEVILLYQKDQHVATVRLKEIHLQPYDVEDGKFSITHRCNQVVIGGPDEEPFVQDETIPLAVGCTLALITLLILVGFSVHRAYHAAKVDYNTVE